MISTHYSLPHMLNTLLMHNPGRLLLFMITLTFCYHPQTIKLLRSRSYGAFRMVPIFRSRHSRTENQGLYNYSEAEKVLRIGLALREMLLTTTDIDTVYLSRDNDQIG